MSVETIRSLSNLFICGYLTCKNGVIPFPLMGLVAYYEVGFPVKSGILIPIQ